MMMADDDWCQSMQSQIYNPMMTMHILKGKKQNPILSYGNLSKQTKLKNRNYRNWNLQLANRNNRWQHHSFCVFENVRFWIFFSDSISYNDDGEFQWKSFRTKTRVFFVCLFEQWKARWYSNNVYLFYFIQMKYWKIQSKMKKICLLLVIGKIFNFASFCFVLSTKMKVEMRKKMTHATSSSSKNHHHSNNNVSYEPYDVFFCCCNNSWFVKTFHSKNVSACLPMYSCQSNETKHLNHQQQQQH